jgi:hypothetical protein
VPSASHLTASHGHKSDLADPQYALRACALSRSRCRRLLSTHLQDKDQNMDLARFADIYQHTSIVETPPRHPSEIPWCHAAETHHRRRGRCNIAPSPDPLQLARASKRCPYVGVKMRASSLFDPEDQDIEKILLYQSAHEKYYSIRSIISVADLV